MIKYKKSDLLTVDTLKFIYFIPHEKQTKNILKEGLAFFFYF